MLCNSNATLNIFAIVLVPTIASNKTSKILAQNDSLARDVRTNYG